MSLNKKERKKKKKQNKSRETKREKGKEINYASFLFGLINDHESETTRVRRYPVHGFSILPKCPCCSHVLYVFSFSVVRLFWNFGFIFIFYNINKVLVAKLGS